MSLKNSFVTANPRIKECRKTFLQMIILLMEVFLESIKAALSFKDTFEIYIVSVLKAMVDLLWKCKFRWKKVSVPMFHLTLMFSSVQYKWSMLFAKTKSTPPQGHPAPDWMLNLKEQTCPKSTTILFVVILLANYSIFTFFVTGNQYLKK